MTPNDFLASWKPPANSIKGFLMKKSTWGAKIAWEPRVRITPEMPGNDLLTSLKVPSTYLECFQRMQITRVVEFAWEPKNRLTSKMTLKYLLHTWRLPLTPWGTMGRVLVMLGPFQTQSNVILDEKPTGNIIRLGQVRVCQFPDVLTGYQWSHFTSFIPGHFPRPLGVLWGGPPWCWVHPSPNPMSFLMRKLLLVHFYNWY